MAEIKQILNQFRAVSVVPNSRNCCEAVQAIVGIRFLSKDVPMLPLAECDRFDQCACKYAHWDDRRQDDRRGADSGIANKFFYKNENRSSRRGRRATD